MPEQRDIASVLHARAVEHPDRPFVTETHSGEMLTYGAFLAKVKGAATGFAAIGVHRGSCVNLMLSNSADYLVCAYALRMLGAVEVAINCEARGAALARMLRIAEPVATIVEAEFVERIAEAGCLDDTVGLLVTRGEPPSAAGKAARALRLVLQEQVPAEARFDAPGPLDPAMVIFTSGTTGPSKGCVLSHRSLIRSGEAVRDALALTGHDVVYSPYPLFHARASVLDVLGTVLAGGSVVLAPRFSASRFWDDLHEFGVTVFSIIGTVMQILWKQPPNALERGHRVRIAWGGPITVTPGEFEQRFGTPVLPGDGVFGMSETGMLNMSSFDPAESGRIRSIYEVIIADENDNPVPAGEIGEILVRPREPGVLFSGYIGMPQATIDATRNLWFHTGDLGRMDSEGRMAFVGRKREMVRAGGHNISPWEVEEVIDGHPDVLECAVVGVPSDLGEEVVAVFVVQRACAVLTAESVRSYCADRMARFMVPGVVWFVAELPKTQTGKIAKGDLQRRALEMQGR